MWYVSMVMLVINVKEEENVSAAYYCQCESVLKTIVSITAEDIQ